MNDPVQAALELDTVREGATVVYRLTLPGTPPSKNELGSLPPAWKASRKRSWMRMVSEQAKAQGIPRGNQEIGLAAHLVFPTAARRDPQNYADTLWNWVPDALQGCGPRCGRGCKLHCGVLVDDNEGRIHWPENLGITFGVDSRHAPTKVRRRTVLTISVRKAMPKTADDDER